MVKVNCTPADLNRNLKQSKSAGKRHRLCYRYSFPYGSVNDDNVIPLFLKDSYVARTCQFQLSPT